LKEALRRECAFLTGAGLAAISAAAYFRPSAVAGALPVWAFCSWLLYRGISDNRRKGDPELLPKLGVPTRITMFRGFLVAIASGFLAVPAIAAPAYTSAAILDGIDGIVARRAKRETLLGSNLDMSVDALGILVASLGGILLSKLPIWYAAIGFARYLFVFGIAARDRAGKPVRSLDASGGRRLLAGLQMGFLAAALWPQIPPALTLAAAYPFGAATLVMFLRDWLFVSHRIRGSR
jgi:CDP-diacylglycerol--glycerol-3-phosphate 3-phosphatidyltransferase